MGKVKEKCTILIQIQPQLSTDTARQTPDQLEGVEKNSDRLCHSQ